MLEVFISKNNDNETTVCLVENGKLIETYDKIEENKRKEGNIYVGVVKNIIPGMQAAFVDIGTEKNSFIHIKDILPQINEKEEKRVEEEKNIKKVVHMNTKLLVQVKKDSNQRKGARTSTHINLPGRYVVLMPNTTIITISQKIESEKEKDRLFKIIREKLPANTGAIIRTAAKNKKEEDIIEDVNKLINTWNKIVEKFNQKSVENGPFLLYKNTPVYLQLIIDLLDKNLDKIITDNDPIYKSLCDNEQLKNIKIEFKDNNILDIYELSEQIEKSKKRKIWLNCGGFITIDETEALTAIDVNTGKYIGNNNLEETTYKVNLEATKEIARQLRLRDIGGIIIIDYIDMHKSENKQKIEETLKQYLKQDRAKTQVEGYTKLQLIEMTRKHICSHEN